MLGATLVWTATRRSEAVMSEDNSPDTTAEEFEALRPRLFGVAYRMTGSVVDAEDACQEAWLRWSGGRPIRRHHTGGVSGAYGHEPRHRSAPLRATPEGAVRRSVPSRAARQRRPGRSGGGGRALRLAHAGVPRDARRAHADRARRPAAPRRVRLRVRRGRGRGRPFAATCAGNWRAARARSSTTTAPNPDDPTSSTSNAWSSSSS